MNNDGQISFFVQVFQSLLTLIKPDKVRNCISAFIKIRKIEQFSKILSF